MTEPAPRGRWLALTAALMGWMFDGLEMGLFPLVGRNALKDLFGPTVEGEALAGIWYGVITAGFLVGAATGGVLFGWLGDRIGRVRAMTFSVLVYAGCSGLSAFSAEPWHMAALRFAGALGMGGEWALGVALVMEMFPNRSRAWLAGLIGAFGNFGYLLLACIALTLNRVQGDIPGVLNSVGLDNDSVAYFTSKGNWRLLMLIGAFPAVLTLLLRLFVPESEKWLARKKEGDASHWASRDLLAVLLGAVIGGGVLALWVKPISWAIKIIGTLLGLACVTVCYMYPARQYLKRAKLSIAERKHTLGRMLLAAGLSGVPLLATWGGVMWVYSLVSALTTDPVTKQSMNPDAGPWVQFASALGAAIGCMLAALLGERIGRRPAYAFMCIASAITLYSFYTFNTEFNTTFILMAGVVGLVTASFYGWLPLYLPELFKTPVRATGQGFGFNFGRILAAIGSLQTGALVAAFGGNSATMSASELAAVYAKACSVAAGVYVFGLVLIAFAPETRGKPLPE